ncbi:MAG TPA: hypothetical protein VH593_20770 [Ktedonobacteraceae bacterium]
MRSIFNQWIKKNIVLLANSGSLVGTTAITSLLGFVYWWIAARQFPAEAVGIASAAVSVMLLLGSVCTLGLGTLLITELPRRPSQATTLMSTALAITGGAGIIGGSLFIVAAPHISASLQPLINNGILDMLIFVAGVSLTSMTLVLDQALIGLLRGGLQLWRNALFAATKLLLLFVAGLYLLTKTGIVIYVTWALGNLLALVSLLGFIRPQSYASLRAYLPDWKLIRRLGKPALQHHVLNMTLQTPALLLPVLVTIILSATTNAWFYVAWMIANFVFVVPLALTTTLHAITSAQQSALRQKIRVTLGVAAITGILTNIPLQLATGQILEIFGHAYADQAAWCLRILAAGVFPLIIKNHFISICRIQDNITQAIRYLFPGGLLELVAAIAGAHFASLTGLSLGWLAAICIEALIMLPTVYKAIFGKSNIRQNYISYNLAAIKPVWQLETAILPAIVISGPGTHPTPSTRRKSSQFKQPYPGRPFRSQAARSMK